jgi:hypothetical protein
LDQAARIVANDAPLIMLHSPETYAVMSSHITGFHWIPDTIMRVAYLGWK